MKTYERLRASMVFFIAICVAACSSGGQHIPDAAKQYSNISAVNPSFKPRQGQTVAWYSPIIWSSAALPESTALQSFLSKLVEAQLELKGFKMVTDKQSADYIIGAAIVDGESEQSSQLENLFKLFPSVGKVSDRFAESEALIGIIRGSELHLLEDDDVGSGIALWRSSLKAYVLGESVSEQEREQRFRFFAAQLMRGLPAAQ